MLRRIKRTWSWIPVEITAAPKSLGSHFCAKSLFKLCYKCYPELAQTAVNFLHYISNKQVGFSDHSLTGNVDVNYMTDGKFSSLLYVPTIWTLLIASFLSYWGEPERAPHR